MAGKEKVLQYNLNVWNTLIGYGMKINIEKAKVIYQQNHRQLIYN